MQPESETEGFALRALPWRVFMIVVAGGFIGMQLWRLVERLDRPARMAAPLIGIFLVAGALARQLKEMGDVTKYVYAFCLGGATALIAADALGIF